MVTRTSYFKKKLKKTKKNPPKKQELKKSLQEILRWRDIEFWAEADVTMPHLCQIQFFPTI